LRAERIISARGKRALFDRGLLQERSGAFMARLHDQHVASSVRLPRLVWRNVVNFQIR